MTDRTTDHHPAPPRAVSQDGAAHDRTEAADAARLWRISGMSPTAVETARQAARRAGIPLAAWLGGLIHQVADHEEAEGDEPASSAGPEDAADRSSRAEPR